jgi:hypothetical protein
MSVPQGPARSGNISTEGMSFPFEIYSEFVHGVTGQFVSVCKLKPIHLLYLGSIDGTEAMFKLVKVCARIDGEPLTDNELMNLDLQLFNKIAIKLVEQMK